MNNEELIDWDIHIESSSSLLNLDFMSVWRYRDLLRLLIRRDFVSVYKQTVLGPVWFIIQPLLTTITFTIIFGNVANISTDGLPKILFYMSGITLWNYFSGCLVSTSNTFRNNQNLFGKVYFPRIIMPISVVVNNFFKLGIQMILFACFWMYYYFTLDDGIQLNPHIALLPLVVLIIAALGLGMGMIISSMTTKYRDLAFLVGFGVQLLMYASPVVYPISVLSDTYRQYVMLNPMSSIIEYFKYATLGEGYFSWFWMGYSCVFTIVIFFLGVLVFNKVEKSFIDTV